MQTFSQIKSLLVLIVVLAIVAVVFATLQGKKTSAHPATAPDGSYFRLPTNNPPSL